MDWMQNNIILFCEAILAGIAYYCLPQDYRDGFQQLYLEFVKKYLPCLEFVKKYLPPLEFVKKYLPQYDRDRLRQWCLEFVKNHIVDEAPEGSWYD